MGGRVVEFPLATGGSVFVEVADDDPGGNLRVGRGGVSEAAKTFEETVGTIKPIADALLAPLTKLAHAPDEIDVDLAFKLSGEGKLLLVASLKGEASCSVKLKWRRQAKPPAGTG